MKARTLFLTLLGVFLAGVAIVALVPAARPAGLMSGLIRLLHGTPDTRPPGMPDATAAKVTFAPGVAVDRQVLDFLGAFAEAMRLHDGAALKPRLSTRYAIEGLPPGGNAVDFFLQAVTRVKGPREIVVRSIEQAADGRVVTTEFRNVDGAGKTRVFKFDADGKLLSADFFSLQRQGHGM